MNIRHISIFHLSCTVISNGFTLTLKLLIGSPCDRDWPFLSKTTHRISLWQMRLLFSMPGTTFSKSFSKFDGTIFSIRFLLGTLFVFDAIISIRLIILQYRIFFKNVQTLNTDYRNVFSFRDFSLFIDHPNNTISNME